MPLYLPPVGASALCALFTLSPDAIFDNPQDGASLTDWFCAPCDAADERDDAERERCVTPERVLVELGAQTPPREAPDEHWASVLRSMRRDECAPRTPTRSRGLARIEPPTLA